MSTIPSHGEATHAEAPVAPARPGLDRRRRVLLGVTLVAGAIALRGLATFDGSASSALSGGDDLFFAPIGSTPRLIFVVTLLLVHARWSHLRSRLGEPAGPLVDSVPLCIGAALVAWAHFVDRTELLVPALSCLMLGLGGALAGRSGARRMAFPAVFVLLALPLPRVLANQLLHPLQLATAGTVAWILRAIGVPAVQLGELIVTQDHVFQVIEACSGLRGIVTMVMAAMVYVDVFDRRGARGWLLVSVAPLIGFAINQLRILSIVASPTVVDESTHTFQGIVTIVVGVLALAGLDAVVVRAAPETPSTAPPDPPPSVRRPGGIPVALAASTALWVGAATFTTMASPWPVPPDPALEVSSFPDVVGDWRAVSRRPIDRDFLGSVGFDRCTLRDYVRGEETVELLVCTDTRAHGGDRMLARKLWVPGSGWALDPAAGPALESSSIPLETSLARSRDESRLVAHWRVGARSIPVEVVREVLGLDRSPFRRPDRAVAVRVSTVVERSDVDGARAAARVSAFLEDARPSLAEVGAVDGPV